MRTNRALWTVQVLLAVLFVMTGTMKLVLPLAQLASPIHLPGSFVRFLGVAEILGAVGLVVPCLTGIRPELTALAASGLVAIMIGATVLTAEGPGVAAAGFPLLVGLLALSVAYGRRGELLGRRTTSIENCEFRIEKVF